MVQIQQCGLDGGGRGRRLLHGNEAASAGILKGEKSVVRALTWDDDQMAELECEKAPTGGPGVIEKVRLCLNLPGNLSRSIPNLPNFRFGSHAPVCEGTKESLAESLGHLARLGGQRFVRRVLG